MAIVSTATEDAPVQCVWFRRRGDVTQKCNSVGTIRAGMGMSFWKVCSEHASWWNPAWMPVWWYRLSALLAAVVGTAVLLVLMVYAVL